MRASDFTPQASGALVPILEGKTPAFVPHPLPPTIQLDNRVINLLSLASHRLGELNGAAQMLPNPGLLITPFLNREAVLSSRIEGTIATAKDLALQEVAPAENVSSDVQEVSNYVKAMRHGQSQLLTMPICVRMMKEMHEILLDGVRGQQRRPGHFRQIQNFIGMTGQTIEQARFVPPPVAEMDSALNDLERYINEQDDLPVLVKVALIHYQFETIHPFIDGNGRIGRLLVILLLLSEGVLSQPMLYLSAYFEKNRNDYVDGLLRVSQTGDWIGWLTYFLNGVEEQARDAILRTKKLLSIWQDYRTRCQEVPKTSALLLKLVDSLLAVPALNNNEAAKILSLTFSSAQKHVEKLVELGILSEVTGRKRDRVFVAHQVIDIIEQEDLTSPTTDMAQIASAGTLAGIRLEPAQ